MIDHNVNDEGGDGDGGCSWVGGWGVLAPESGWAFYFRGVKFFSILNEGINIFSDAS